MNIYLQKVGVCLLSEHGYHLNRNQLELIFRVASGGLSMSHPFHCVVAVPCALILALNTLQVAFQSVRGIQPAP